MDREGSPLWKNVPDFQDSRVKVAIDFHTIVVQHMRGHPGITTVFKTIGTANFFYTDGISKRISAPRHAAASLWV